MSNIQLSQPGGRGTLTDDGAVEKGIRCYLSAFGVTAASWTLTSVPVGSSSTAKLHPRLGWYFDPDILGVYAVRLTDTLSVAHTNTFTAARTITPASLSRSVLSYGAKGDGVTDDSAAIAAAIAATPTTGGGLFFPDGTYYLASQVLITSYQHLTIWSDCGAALQLKKNTPGLVLSACSDVEITGIRIKGTVTVDGGDVGGGNTSQHGITLEAPSRVNIHHCTFQETGGYGVFVHTNCQDVTVQSNWFIDTFAGCQCGAGAGFTLKDIKVIDNTFLAYNPAFSGGAGSYGSDDQIACFGGTSGSIVIARNYIDKRGTDASTKAKVQAHCIVVESGGVGGDIRDIVIEDNICVNCASTHASLDRAAIEVFASPGGVPSNIHISGNIIRTCNEGIYINPEGGAYIINDIQIHGNDISDVQAGTTSHTTAINLSAPGGGGGSINRISICDNKINTVAAAATSAGIHVGVVSNAVKVANNYVTTVSGGSGQGIFFNVGGSDWDVSHNRVTGCGANGFLIVSTAGGGRLRFIGNQVESSTSHGVNLQAMTDVLVMGNISNSNTGNGFDVTSLTDAQLIGNTAALNGAAGLQTTTQVTNFRCALNSFHNNTGYGIVFAGTNCSATFIGNYLTGNTLGTFSDGSVTSNKRFLENPQLTTAITGNNRGQATIVNAAVNVAVAFATNEPDATYMVQATSNPQAGAAASVAYVTAKAIGGFTVNITVAPGGGLTTLVDWVVFR